MFWGPELRFVTESNLRKNYLPFRQEWTEWKIKTWSSPLSSFTCSSSEERVDKSHCRVNNVLSESRLRNSTRKLSLLDGREWDRLHFTIDEQLSHKVILGEISLELINSP